MQDFLIGLILNVVMGLAAYAKKSVKVSGLIMGVIVGTWIFYFGGLMLWVLLAGFFASSTALSFFKRKKKREAAEMGERGEVRDFVQVLANSGMACVMAFLYWHTADRVYLLGFTAVFAACNSDTWASEVGVLSRRPPVSIVSLRPVPRGASGGVSLLGLLASLLGSTFIAVLFFGGYRHNSIAHEIVPFLTLVIIGGFLGSIIDSLLGATVQAQYFCPETEKITEKRFKNGRPTKLIRGYPCINNDMVNFLSSSMTALLVMGMYAVMVR